MKEILSHLHDDDDIAIAWWDYEEMGDHAEEQGVTLSKDQWARVVKKFEQRLNIDAPLIEFIDELIKAHGSRVRSASINDCDHCGVNISECECECDDCGEYLSDCLCEQ